MDELSFSAREFLFAGAQVGAKTFYGIQDPFFGMTPEEIRLEIEAMQLALEKKGYAEIGFDDAFALKPDVVSMVGVCAKCRRYLLVKGSQPGGDQKTLLVYSGEQGLVEAEVCGEDVKLKWIGEEDVVGRVIEEVLPAAPAGGTPARVPVKQSDLAAVQTLAIDEPQKALEALTGQGFSEEAAAALLQGFRGEASRYVFCKSDFVARTLTEMVLIQGEAGAVCMTLEDEYEDLWNADYLPDGVTEEHLKDLCALKGVADEML